MRSLLAVAFGLGFGVALSQVLTGCCYDLSDPGISVLVPGKYESDRAITHHTLTIADDFSSVHEEYAVGSTKYEIVYDVLSGP